MDSGQKYLGVGMGIAIAIAVFLKAFIIFGTDSNFWLAILGLISAGMIYLVLNIFLVTKKLTPAIDTTGNAGNNKSRNFTANK